MKHSKLRRYLPSIICLKISAIALYFALAGHSDNYIRDRVVRLQTSQGFCSGEQVRAPSGTDYILTAAHCRTLADANNQIEVKTEDGKVLKRRIVNEDPTSDLLLLEGLPGVRGLSVAKYAPMRSEIRIFSHGRALDTYEADGKLVQFRSITVPLMPIITEAERLYCSSMPKYMKVDMGYGMELCLLNVVETVTTARVAPGSSGGPIVDSSGDLVGVVSAGDPEFSYLVTLPHILSFLRNY